MCVAMTPPQPQWPATETLGILEEVTLWLQATTGNLLSQVASWLYYIGSVSHPPKPLFSFECM